MTQLILALGSNIGDRIKNLENAQTLLSKSYPLKFRSQIYQSKAVDYTEQPHFYNRVLQFSLNKNDSLSSLKILQKILIMERILGRMKTFNKGPRKIDIDIIFFGISTYHSKDLTLPHPRALERSFVVLPLMELPYFHVLKKKFIFPSHFIDPATPLII